MFRLPTITIFVATFLFSTNVFPQAIIAGQDVPAHAITRGILQTVFSMRLHRWPNGTPVTVFVLESNNPVHISFCKQVLDLYPHQLQRIWDRQVFSGTGQAPQKVGSEAEMIEMVSRTPGAIGYSTESLLDESVQILQLK